MGPISPVSIGAAGASAGMATAPSRPFDVPDTNAGRAIGKPAASGRAASSDAIATLCSALSDLLQGVGGAQENDRVLRMMIALIILLALLQSTQGTGAPEGNTLAPLGLGGSAQPQSVGVYSSSTTIMLEQTTTTISLQSMESYSLASDSDTSGARGGQIDLSA
jgi:hypothetical protein